MAMWVWLRESLKILTLEKHTTSQGVGMRLRVLNPISPEPLNSSTPKRFPRLRMGVAGGMGSLLGVRGISSCRIPAPT